MLVANDTAQSGGTYVAVSEASPWSSRPVTRYWTRSAGTTRSSTPSRSSPRPSPAGSASQRPSGDHAAAEAHHGGIGQHATPARGEVEDPEALAGLVAPAGDRGVTGVRREAARVGRRATAHEPDAAAGAGPRQDREARRRRGDREASLARERRARKAVAEERDSVAAGGAPLDDTTACDVDDRGAPASVAAAGAWHDDAEVPPARRPRGRR
jgi:hypothetical protein